MTPYRYDIGIDKNQIFGIEIEFATASLNHLAEIFKRNQLDVIYEKNHFHKNTTYESWYLDKDITISWDQGFDILGGELSSRLLTNKKDIWQEIELILKILMLAGATISDCCSAQVSIDLSNINHGQHKQTFYKTLSQIIALYETDMELFYMGDTYFKRQTKDYYAKSVKDILLNKLMQIEEDSHIVNYHDLLVYAFPTLTHRIYGIKIEENENIERIEFRYPNGTLNEKTLQNYINFSLKLFAACKKGNLDQEQLDYLTKSQIKLFEDGNDCIYNPNPKAFEKLIEIISFSHEDIDDFSQQYQKVLSSKNKLSI